MSATPHLTRRRVLSGLALSLPASAALAFGESPMPPKLTALHQAGCGPTADHKAFLAEVEKTLGSSLTEAEKRDLLAKITCPVCGCSLGTF